MNPGEKECPFCFEVIKAKAVKCRHCGSFLELPPTFNAERANEPHQESPAKVPSHEVAELLQSLVTRSLVTFDEITGRYRLLETVREYAGDRLLMSGERAYWRSRHLIYVVTLADSAGLKLAGTQGQEWLERLDTEHDNLRAALEWSITGEGDSEAGIRLAGSLWRFWQARGFLAQGRSWLEALISASDEGRRNAARANALEGAGVFAWRQGDFSDAYGLHKESLGIRREIGDTLGIAWSLSNLGLVTWQLGDHARATALHEESLALRRQLGDKHGIADSLNILGTAAHETGDFRFAQKLHEESLSIFTELDDKRGIVMCLIDLGNAALEQAEYSAARARYKEGLTILIEQGDRLRIAQSLEGCAQLASALNAHLQAARIWGTAERLREEVAAPLLPHERTRRDRHIAAARIALGDDAAFDAAWQEGRAMKLERAIELALEQAEIER